MRTTDQEGPTAFLFPEAHRLEVDGKMVDAFHLPPRWYRYVMGGIDDSPFVDVEEKRSNQWVDDIRHWVDSSIVYRFHLAKDAMEDPDYCVPLGYLDGEIFEFCKDFESWEELSDELRVLVIKAFGIEAFQRKRMGDSLEVSLERFPRYFELANWFDQKGN